MGCHVHNQVRCQIFDPVGRRLLRFIHQWKLLHAQELVERGMQGEWKSSESPKILRALKRNAQQIYSTEQFNLMQQDENKELEQGIIKEEHEKEVAFPNSCFHRSKKNQKELRKILDCAVIDQLQQDISFKMEDLYTIKQLLQQGDYAVTIDIQSAYSHTHVDQDLSPYLSFNFNNRCYSYVAIPFRIKSVPRTFTKMLRPVVAHIRISSGKILASATTIDKSGSDNLIPEVQSSPCHQFTFLGWIFNAETIMIQFTEDRQVELLKRLQLWKESINKAKLIRIKDLANMIGKQCFTRTQFGQASLHFRFLNSAKAKAQYRQGRESKAVFNKGTLKELNWWTLKLSLNNPTSLIIRKPDT
ncbi:MAG: hypothetical protein EZS28_016077, partial [Streblomastix strix]